MFPKRVITLRGQPPARETAVVSFGTGERTVKTLAEQKPIRFGLFEVDTTSGELRKQGTRVKLQEQPYQVLIALLERPGEVLSREDLQKRLWPSDVTVDFERGLNKAVNRLREALGDDADTPKFIETMPQRGYRFVAEVECAAAVERPLVQAEPSIPAPHVSMLVSRRGLFLIAGTFSGALLCLLGYRAAYRLLFDSPQKIESIAVLPLENLSGNPDQEYFSDGMTDTLIGEIARIGSLRVISRTSVMLYKRRAQKTLPQIARELNVDAIIEGTVVQSGTTVRITAQLIRARDDRHLWSERYERDLRDILGVQSAVARAIADQIQIKLTPQEHRHLTHKRSVRPEAYDAFLRGTYALHQGIRGTENSIAFFRRAIGLDPSHADSYAGLAEALCFSGIFGLRPSAEAYPEARQAALKALEQDDSNASAHDALGEVKQGYDWDLAGAQQEFRRALELNPANLVARLRYAENLTRMKKYDQAVEETERTLSWDPVSPISLVSRSMIFFRARRYTESIDASRQALELDPTNVNALWWQGVSYAGKHEYGPSIAALRKALSIADGPLMRGYLGYVYAKAGEKEKALGILEELTALSKSNKRFVSPVDFALIYAGLGDADATFECLERAYRSHEGRFELASMYYDAFRSDPRYANLARRVGMPL